MPSLRRKRSRLIFTVSAFSQPFIVGQVAPVALMPEPSGSAASCKLFRRNGMTTLSFLAVLLLALSRSFDCQKVRWTASLLTSESPRQNASLAQLVELCQNETCYPVNVSDVLSHTGEFRAVGDAISWLSGGSRSPLSEKRWSALPLHARAAVETYPGQFWMAATEQGLQQLDKMEEIHQVSNSVLLTTIPWDSNLLLYSAVDHQPSSTNYTWVLVCAAEADGAAGLLQCWTPFGKASLISGGPNSSLTLPAGSSESPTERAAVVLLMHRLIRRAAGLQALHTVEDKNALRQKEVQLWVGSMYALAAVALFGLLLSTAARLSHAFPLRVRQMNWSSHVFWVFIVSTIAIVVGAAGGIYGWLVVIFLLMATHLAVALHMSVRKCRARSKVGPHETGTHGRADEGDHVEPTQKKHDFRAHSGKLILWGGVATFLLLSLCAVILLVSWVLSPYFVLDHQSQQPLEEFQPQDVGKVLQLLYGFDSVAVSLRLAGILGSLTSSCGKTFSAELNDQQKEGAIKKDYIDKYSINMELYTPSSYTEYDTVNSWFIRRLAPGLRPISGQEDDDILVSVADSRVVVFQTVPEDVKVWLKGEGFTIAELLDNPSEDLRGGSIAIFRLAPQDYHRYHSHTGARVVKQYEVEGPYYSVFSDAIRSDNGAIYNQRIVTRLESGGQAGNRVSAFVAIGATCVGSIVMSATEGSEVEKGEELGYFQFGGSTVVVVFPPEAVLFDPLLVERSQKEVETYLHVGQRIGRWL